MPSHITRFAGLLLDKHFTVVFITTTTFYILINTNLWTSVHIRQPSTVKSTNMRFATSILALAASIGLVAAQNKCDAQKYVKCSFSHRTRMSILPSSPRIFYATQSLTRPQHRRRLRLRLPKPHRRVQQERQRLHLPVRRVHRRPRVLQQLPQQQREAARCQHRVILLRCRGSSARCCVRVHGVGGQRCCDPEPCYDFLDEREQDWWKHRECAGERDA